MPDRLGPVRHTLAVSASALRNGAIRRTTVAYLAFNTVEYAVWTTLLVFAYGATGPASIGVVVISQMLPSAILAPLLANIGDRFPRAFVLLGWFLVQALAVAATGAAILLGAPPALVYAVSAVASVTLTQTRPIVASLLPELAGSPEELTAANALSSISMGLGGFIGPVAAAFVLAVSDPGITFLAAALVLAGGALAVAGVHGRADEPRTDGAEELPGREPGALLAGLREVGRDPDLAVVMALLTAEFVIYGGLEVLLVIMAIELMDIGESGAGILLGALGLGAIVGGGASFALVGQRRLAPWLGVAAVIIGLSVALVGFSAAPRSAVVLLTIAGIGFAVLDVAGQTLLQRITPDVVRARVFGVLEGVTMIGEAVGSLLVPPITVVFGVQGAAVALGLLLPALAAIAVMRFARIDARITLPEAELRALRSVAMFSPLGPAALEALARHLVRVEVVAGSVVIREGDPGDRWYLVEQGRLSVTIAGEPRRELGPGDGFGEIALLRNVPRTATVTAIDDGIAWTLEREEFLAAVTGSPGALLEAQRLAAVRLG